MLLKDKCCTFNKCKIKKETSNLFKNLDSIGFYYIDFPHISVRYSFHKLYYVFASRTCWKTKIKRKQNCNFKILGVQGTCTEQDLRNISPLSTAAFPKTMTRAQFHNLAYSSLTSTLVFCGGSQVGIILLWGRTVFIPFVF
jgi:hypothetical protein